ncbi:hypothetical protein KIN20_000587 [Parelaphostrongylus tenuis]|uniref:Uncharacterized protein n=1 Tax=Parelaphostrongylus tenuis TaxID=148309 RepID=A0AAD5LSR7_PARTN|nr:hypothetical protein KIN20_000587 [Parelaphostrongylus tenuis]
MNTSRSAPRRERSFDSQASSISSSQLLGQNYREVEGECEPEYCYALPVKPDLLNVCRSQRGSYANIHCGTGHSEDIPSHPHKHSEMANIVTPVEPTVCRISPQSCIRHNGTQERASEHLNADLSNQYYASSVPMLQYVPVMVTPQPAVIPTHMNQAVLHPSVLMPTSTFSRGTYCRPHMPIAHGTKNSSEDRTRDLEATIKSAVAQPKFDSVRSVSSIATQGGCCDYVPSSVHSTVSVASQIRNMPVPNSNRDLDRFLDEVFDQVLSPHDLAVELNTHEIASSIKGGAYGSTSCISVSQPSSTYKTLL